MTKTLLVFALAVLAVGTATGALIKETNTYNGMTNVALGGTPFAPASLNGYAIHHISNLNDGIYGNSNSWIQGQSSPHGVLCGVKLAGPKTVSGVAFGRDNTGTYSDRANGYFTVQYTMLPNPEDLSLLNTGDPTTGWSTIGSVSETDPLRKRYAVTPPVQATGVRIVMNSEQLCIDEFEILEDPSTHDPAVAAFCDDIASKCTAMADECTTLTTLGHSSQVANDCDDTVAVCNDMVVDCQAKAASCPLV